MSDSTSQFLSSPSQFVKDQEDSDFWATIFGTRNFFVTSRALAIEVLQTRDDNFSGRLGNREVSEELFGKSVLYADGKEHSDLRKAMSSLFRPKSIEINELVSRILEVTLSNECNLKNINVHNFFQRLSLQITSAYFFNESIDYEYAGSLIPLIDGLAVGLYSPANERESNTDFLHALDCRKKLDRTIQVQPKSPLTLALRSHSYPDEVILDQIITFLFAGVDTMSVTLSWALEILLSEKTDTLKPREAINRALLERPPVYFIPRGSYEDTYLGSEKINQGDVVNVMVCSLHEQAIEGSGGLNMPFGIGNKKCPGQSFSLMVMDNTLSFLMRNFKVLLEGGDLSLASYIPGQRPLSPPAIVLSKL